VTPIHGMGNLIARLIPQAAQKHLSRRLRALIVIACLVPVGCAGTREPPGPSLYRLPIPVIQIGNDAKETIYPEIHRLPNGNRIAIFPYEFQIWKEGKNTGERAWGCKRAFEIDPDDIILRAYDGKGCEPYWKYKFYAWVKIGVWEELTNYPFPERFNKEYSRSQDFYRPFDGL